ncbi:hypothetical protein NQ318_008384 [Aromia moschata]|uniref:Integrase p58-like C-terminal domain-containing protein n=1 Tax=Aromia moschata TaxID=1265417 RepID=A0AAV8YJW5_9CUCU|nr:hypothetical protein NQ318_008384 [Aromia moschata]
MGEYVDEKFGEMENKLVTVEEEFQNKFLEMERKFATLGLEGGLSKPELSSHVEISKIRMKPTQFDGKSSWVNYLRQFEAAAKANGWSLAEKATALTLALHVPPQACLPFAVEEPLSENIESLKEFKADIAQLVRLAYSSTPENVMERLALQAFLVGLRDTEIRQALTLARPSKLVDTLARALEFEAAKQSCRGQAKVRKMEENVEEGTCNEAEIRRVVEEILDKRPIRRWTGVERCVLKRVLEKSDGTEERKQLIVPRNRVPEVLKEIHNGSTGGQLGATKTLGKFLHLYLLAYRSSVHETSGQTPASIVMGRELRLPCHLKFGCTPGDDVAGEDYVSTLRQRMDDIHKRVRSKIQGASDRMKETYDINANDGRYQPGNQVWLYNPQRTRGLSPKLQSFWEGPYEVITQINDVVYRIQKLPRGKPRVVHFNRLAPFAGSNHEQAEARVRHVSPPDSELSFEEFMLLPFNGQKARYSVTREEPRDLFQVPADFCLAHCVAADLRMSRGIALTFKKAFGQLEELGRQRPEVGRVLQITVAQQEKERSVFYLVTKKLSHHKPTYQNVWDTLIELRNVLLSLEYKQFRDTEDSQRSRWPGLGGDKKYSGSPFPVYWNRNPGMLLQPQRSRMVLASPAGRPCSGTGIIQRDITAMHISSRGHSTSVERKRAGSDRAGEVFTVREDRIEKARSL